MHVRRTKIIATLGPATESEEMLAALIDRGVNIFRLNMSHAPHDWVRTVSARVRTLAARASQPVALLLDTQGPAIRTGDLPTKLDLKVGDTFTFTVRGHQSEELHSVDTNYDDLVKDIHVGDVVLVDNGVIRMLVKEKCEKELKCEVLTPGTLGSRRHINLPGIKVNLPALTEKDLQDVAVGVECGVDFVALSFVREANDVEILRQVLATHDAADTSIIAKIEDQSAVRNINEIIQAADGVMVARGDLGIECPYEELPIIQRRIVKKCLTQGKPVIVATHMLESMITNPIPTRAEITDVANAVFEQSDCIMLSGETTVGRYPLSCVEVLDRVARRIERSGGIGFSKDLPLSTPRHMIASSAIDLANNLHASGLVIFTRTGRMAAVCAALRPRSTPIFAFTPDTHLTRQFCLRYGVYGYPLEFDQDPEETLRRAETEIRRLNLVPSGATVVVISDIISEGRTINAVQVRTLH